MMPLNELRRRRALSIAALAELAGVAPKTINDVERGLVVPKLRTVRRLCDALAVEPADVTEFAAAVGIGPAEKPRGGAPKDAAAG